MSLAAGFKAGFEAASRRGKPRRLKLEQMHMNVYIFKQVSPSLKGPLQLYALHGPMFLFVDRLGFSLSPLGLFPN